MNREQLKLAWVQQESRRKRCDDQRCFVEELDVQLEAAIKRWELSLHGQDAHKVLAEMLTDDPEHPVAVTTVYDWLARRNGRRPPGELIAILYDVDSDFAAWWNIRHSYSVPEKLSRIPWEQERTLYRRALQEFGAAGEMKLRTIANAKPEEAP